MVCTQWLFLYSIYPMQVLLQVISLSYPQQCLRFQMLQHILTTLLFSLTNLSQGDFLYYPILFYTKVHTARTPTGLKKNLLHCPFFGQFCQVIECQARWVQSFFQSFNIRFFHCNRKGAKLNQCFSPGRSLVNYSVQLQMSSGANPDLIVD